MADKSAKAGRKSNVCQAYKLSNRREKNKARKLRRHVLANPNDPCALAAYLNVYRFDSESARKAVKATDKDVTPMWQAVRERANRREVINRAKIIRAAA
jgi:hypothetical protein